MSAGKIASQVAHATFMVLEQYSLHDHWKIITPWKNTGMCVIVLECKDVAALLSADKYLEQWDIIRHLYIDEGLTEVDALTPTALATGIIPEDKQWIFEKFKLYGARK